MKDSCGYPHVPEEMGTCLQPTVWALAGRNRQGIAGEEIRVLMDGVRGAIG